MFITFNTKKQALNYLKRNQRHLNYSHNEGCGCCWSYSSSFIDGTKVVQSFVACYQGSVKASATVIGKIKKGRQE